MIGVEHCDRCKFDRGQWTEQDAQRTLLFAESMLADWSRDARPKLDPKLRARQVDDLKAIEASPDLFDKVHHLMHGLTSIADLRRAGDDAVERQVGTISQISVSNGGVPKTAVTSSEVDVRGLVDDVQATRLHHGRPWQALCLWSQDVIDEFAAAGHPIAAGSAGDNITISGVDWQTMRGGTIIDLGGVRCQLSAPAVPCSKNAPWFIDGDISLMDHDQHPGKSRWYASVLTPGNVATGDAVTVSP